MLIERQIEKILKTQIAQTLSEDNFEVLGSWEPSDSGSFKGEHDAGAKGIVSIYVQPRENDSFSLPTINMRGVVSLQCRAEQCPTMAEVSEVYEKISDLLDGWHFDAKGFSDVFTTQQFFAAEIKLDGGDKVAFDTNYNAWNVDMYFVIRGTVIH